jgi:hypothetical protein
MTACETSPCQNSVSESAGVSSVALSSFGDSYTTSSFDQSFNGIVLSTPGMMVVGNPSVTLSASGFSAPSFAIQGSVLTTNGGSAGGGGTMVYFFEVVPNNGNTTPTAVNVGVTATGSVSATTSGGSTATDGENGAVAQAELQIAGNTTLTDLAELSYSYGCTDVSCTATNVSQATGSATVSTPGVNGASVGASSNMFGGFSESGTSLSVETNTAIEIQLSVQLNINGATGASGSASIDPIITVPNGYMLIESAGVGNSAAAPEPGTWVLLAAGCGLLCAVKRRAGNRLF